jgi:hypothetical protein
MFRRRRADCVGVIDDESGSWVVAAVVGEVTLVADAVTVPVAGAGAGAASATRYALTTAAGVRRKW